MYATTFNGDVQKANTLKVNSNYSGDTAPTANTVAVRDDPGNLVANEFTGVKPKCPNMLTWQRNILQVKN